MEHKTVETVITNIDEKYILEAAKYIKEKRGKQHRKMGRIRKLAACFITVMILSMPTLVLATSAGSIPAYDILYNLYPEIARKLTPVHLSSVDNGIQMEVEAVDIENDTAMIYLSMKDLEQDRIDETIDLFDSYHIHSSADSIGTCSRIGYNEEEKEATFLIQLQQMHGKEITGKKLTFSVTEFLSGKREMDEELPQIALDYIDRVTDTQQEIERRGAGGLGNWELVTNFLKENEQQSFSPIDGVRVTAYGFVDGRLHVQAHYENILETDNHGYIYFKDKEGNVIHSDVSIGFWDEEHKGSYEEYVFNIFPEDDLTEYTVWGYFWVCPNLTKGNWKVTFPVEEVDNIE